MLNSLVNPVHLAKYTKNAIKYCETMKELCLIIEHFNFLNDDLLSIKKYFLNKFSSKLKNKKIKNNVIQSCRSYFINSNCIFNLLNNDIMLKCIKYLDNSHYPTLFTISKKFEKFMKDSKPLYTN